MGLSLQNIGGLVKRMFGGGTTADDLAAKNALLTRRVSACKPAADAMAADDSIVPVCTVPAAATNGMKVEKLGFLPHATLTADATNNKIVTFKYCLENLSDYASAVTIGSYTTSVAGTGNFAIGKFVAATVTNPIVPAGSVILAVITHGGSGVVHPAGEFEAWLAGGL